MDNVVITLQHRDQEVDVDLPADLPLAHLGPILVESLLAEDEDSPWRALAPQNEETVCSARSIANGIVVRPSETLAQAGVVDGDILELMLVSVHQEAVRPPSTTATGRAYLRCVATDKIFNCRGRANLVGRTRQSAINLSPLPESDVVSRRHANIIRRRDGYWIKDERSTNGTIVDGYNLQPGERVRIRHNSRIQFGEDGPILLFNLD
jgi:hypothetical protein